MREPCPPSQRHHGSGPGGRSRDATDKAPCEYRYFGRSRTRLYNEVRPHWALVPPEGGDPVTPAEVYVHRQRVGLPKRQGWAKAAREKLNAIIEDAHFPRPAEPTEVAA